MTQFELVLKELLIITGQVNPAQGQVLCELSSKILNLI